MEDNHRYVKVSTLADAHSDLLMFQRKHGAVNGWLSTSVRCFLSFGTYWDVRMFHLSLKAIATSYFGRRCSG